MVLAGHPGRVTHAEFSPDGARVATGAEDGSARVTQVDGSSPPVVLRRPGDAYVKWAEFSRDGRHVVTAIENAALVWNADGSGVPVVLPARGNREYAHFSPDGTQAPPVVADSSPLELRP